MTDSKIAEIIEQVAEHVGGTVNDSYSGRGMFGATCYSIYCNDHIACIEEASARGLRNACYDQMGKGMVVYWPGVTK